MTNEIQTSTREIRSGKSIELLLVEDNPQYITMCKNLVDYVNTRGRVVGMDSFEHGSVDFYEVGPISLNVVSSKDAALSTLDSKKYDAVICDLFFPSNDDGVTTMEDKRECQRLLRTSCGYEHGTSKVVSYVDSITETADGELIPLGVLVGRNILERKLIESYQGKYGLESPLVFCTNGHHHGSKVQAVTDVVRSLGLDSKIYGATQYLVDTIEGEYENFENVAKGKNFGEALFRALKLLGSGGLFMDSHGLRGQYHNGVRGREKIEVTPEFLKQFEESQKSCKEDISRYSEICSGR